MISDGPGVVGAGGKDVEQIFGGTTRNLHQGDPVPVQNRSEGTDHLHVVGAEDMYSRERLATGVDRSDHPTGFSEASAELRF